MGQSDRFDIVLVGPGATGGLSRGACRSPAITVVLIEAGPDLESWYLSMARPGALGEAQDEDGTSDRARIRP